MEEIFASENPALLAHQLRAHCFQKEQTSKVTMTEVEQVFFTISGMGSVIAGDGFISVFHQFLTPDSFPKACDAWTEVGASELRKLMVEAWLIYTKDKSPITLEELQSISVRCFNTKDKMDRFDEIGEEVEAILQKQYEMGKVYAVEYARQHRAEFTPIVK